MSWSHVRSAGLGIALLILLAPATTLADVLVLKNGDEITGRFANRQF